MIKRLAFTTLLGLTAGFTTAACGGDDQPPPATPVPTATAPTPPPVDTSDAAAAATPPKPSMEAMVAAVEKAFVATAHDPAQMAALFAPDGVEWNFGSDPNKGRDAIQANRAGLLQMFPDFAIGDAQMWSKGNMLAIHWVATGTDKASGKKVGVHGLDVLTLNDDGLITLDHGYYDTTTVLKQTGAYVGQTPAPAVATLPTSIELHAAKNDDTEAKNAAGIVTLNAAWTKGDDKTYLAGMSDDVINYSNDDGLLPHPRKEMAPALAAFRKAVTIVSATNTTTFAVEDFTINESECTMTQKAAYKFGKTSIPNTKKTATTHSVEIDQWKDGKITKSWNFGNGLELDQQLGIGAAAPAKATPATKSAKPAAKP